MLFVGNDDDKSNDNNDDNDNNYSCDKYNYDGSDDIKKVTIKCKDVYFFKLN